jgi:urease accessory protein
MKKLIFAAGLTLMAAPAMAHPGHGLASFGDGVLHPIAGADHLLAMLSVGLWSGFAMPRRLWAGAASFLAAMLLGAGVAWSGVILAGVEPAILASVLVFGAMVFWAKQAQSRAGTLASLAGIAVFASLHGYAHAVESTGGGYLLGFLISTAALHLVGIGLARATARWAAADVAQKVLGGAVAASGLYLMVG